MDQCLPSSQTLSWFIRTSSLLSYTSKTDNVFKIFIVHQFKQNNSVAIVAFSKLMALIAKFLLASYANAFPSLSLAAGSQVQFKEKKPQQDLVDAWSSNAISNAISNASLQTTNDFQHRVASHLNNGCLCRLIVDSVSEGAHAAPIIFCNGFFELIVACSYIASIFQDFSSNDFRLVVDFTLVLNSEGA